MFWARAASHVEGMKRMKPELARLYFSAAPVVALAFIESAIGNLLRRSVVFQLLVNVQRDPISLLAAQRIKANRKSTASCSATTCCATTCCVVAYSGLPPRSPRPGAPGRIAGCARFRVSTRLLALTGCRQFSAEALHAPVLPQAKKPPRRELEFPWRV